jgi:hypothetical protein
MSKSANKDRFAVGSVDWIRAKAQEAVAGGDAYAWVRDVFRDSVIIEIEVDEYGKRGELYSMSYSVSGGNITFGDLEPASVEYVAKCRVTNQPTELTGPIVWKNAAKRLAFGAVLVPGEPDSDGDILTAEKIADVAHDWLADYGNIDLQHSLNNVAEPVESYVTTEDMTVTVKSEEVTLPAGSWILGSRVNDDDLWDKVVKGELSGYSVMGVKNTVMKSAKKGQDVALKRTTLADLGPGWVAPFVSLVDEPAVPKAKFFALKAKQIEDEESQGGFFSRVFKKQPNKENDMDAKEVQALIDASNKERDTQIAALKSELDELKNADVKTADDPEPDVPAVNSDEPAAVKSEPTELEKRFDAVEKSISDVTEKLTKLVGGESRAVKADESGSDADDGKGGDSGDIYEDLGRDAFGNPIKQ